MNTPRSVLIASVAAAFLLSCGGTEGARGPRIRIEEGWVRAMPLLEGEEEVSTNSVAYFVLRNDGDQPDRLVGGESAAAEAVEVHETVLVDDVTRMRKVGGLEISPHEAVELAPGGVHAMLLGLKRSLSEGDTVKVTLFFERSSELEVSFPVRTAGVR